MSRAATVLLLLPAAICSLPAQSFELTVPSIMRGPELVGTPPAAVRFSPDGRWVYFRWRQGGVDTLEHDYRARVPDGEPERLPRNAMDTIPTAAGGGAWSPDRRRMIAVLRGDLWLVERTGAKRRLTETREVESAPSWSADAGTVYFRRDDNAWALDVERGRLAQLTDIRRGPAPRIPAEPAGQKKFLREQQRELFDFVRDQVARDQLRADTDSTMPQPLYLAERESVTRLDASPDGRFVLVTVTQRAKGDTLEGRRVEMPVWVTQSGYTITDDVRVKVGDAQPRTRAGVLEVATGTMTWVERPEGAAEKEVTAFGVGISPSGRHALVRVTSTDYEDAWLVVVDLPSRDMRAVAHLHDEAWLGGPLGNTAGWLDDATVYYGSEETGWAHLYTVPAAGGVARALTQGEWEVTDVEPSLDRRTLYVQTSEVHFGERHVYALDPVRGTRGRLTRGAGRHDVTVSPDGRWLAVVHSAANTPPELFFQQNRTGAAPRQVTTSTTAGWRSYPWAVPEIMMVPASDGVAVPARVYRPADSVRNGAGVIFVHGAGYLQNVHTWWSSYYREYMFHHLLVARGYTVLDLDYRASAGHGRAWRTAIYRHMGGKDLDDQVDAARALVGHMGVDSARIGIYGGSYGGFITLMAMFTKPGVFAAGAALRPVTDWAHYNHPYTARILNEPQDDSVAYRRSSPIYHAEGLQGRLLMAHGMVDDNVHFHDTVRLIQRLIELGKTGWEAAIYPVEPHGFVRADSWTDEYRRILELFEETIGRGR